jgi:hypothetical protein
MKTFSWNKLGKQDINGSIWEKIATQPDIKINLDAIEFYFMKPKKKPKP